MSSTGQIVGGVVGAVTGFFVGGPSGAYAGLVIGAGVGSYIDPPKGPTVSGPRLNDRKVQTSTYGATVGRVYGMVGLSGNIFTMENNELKEKSRKKEEGGKGGSSTTVETFTYSATFMLGICEGPIIGIRRIWCSDKLIYNAGSDDIGTIMASNQSARGWKLYTGSDDQLPDPRHEAEHGVGNVSAYRGLAYIAFYDFELADYSNSLQGAQFKVEVVQSADFVPPREAYNAPLLTALNETVPRARIKGNVFSFWYDPTDVRPFVGRSFRWRRRDYRVEDGSFITDEADPQMRSPDSFISGYQKYDIGTSVGMAWVYDFDSTGDPHAYVRGTNNLVNRTFAPYLGEGRDLGVFASDSALWLFRVRSDGSKYAERYPNYYTTDPDVYEIETDDAVTIYCASVGVGHTAVIDDDERTLFIIDCGGPSVRVLNLEGGTFRQKYNFSEHSILFNSISGAASDGLFIMFARDQMSALIYSEKIEFVPPSLASIIEAEVDISSLLTSADIDVTQLTDTVDGYLISGGTLRAAIEPLQGTYPFDFIPSGYKLKGVKRGQVSALDIPWQDMGATDVGGIEAALQLSREMDSQLPLRVNIKYIDAIREYAFSEQYQERLNTGIVNKIDREFPVVIDADKAKQVAEILLYLAWMERTDLTFTLPPSYLALEVADVVTLRMRSSIEQVRLTAINYKDNGRLEITSKRNNPSLYISTASGSEGVPPDGNIPINGSSIAILLDIPVVDESIQNQPGFVAVMDGFSDSWPGGVLFRSPDAGQTWQQVQGFSGFPTAGFAVGVLPESESTMPDRRSITVSLLSGQLESITRDQMLSGMHYVAYGRDQRWEIMRYQDAVLQADGTYVVSGFVRGERGTEWATGLHQEGDYFVVLADPDNIFITMPVESIEQDRTYRAITNGATIDSGSDIPFVYRGVNLETLSGVYPLGRRDGSQNLTVAWTRRSRLSSSWWLTGVPAPVAEATEAYEVDIMDGATVKRTIESNSPSITYTAANQVTDFGSAQAAVTMNIYQMSATAGRGYPLEATL